MFLSLNDHSFIDDLLNESNIITTQEEFATFLLQQKMNMWNLSDFMRGMCIFYGTLFVFGILGNIWVIGIVAYIMKVLRGVIQNPNVFLYILFLSIVDALVLLNLPMLITNMYLFQWIFGQHLCKIYWIVESTNKTLSTMILAALSCDRYLAVCRPTHKANVRSANGTMTLVGVIMVAVVILLAPVYWYANEFAAPEPFMVNNVTLIINVPACNLVMNQDLMLIFTVYLFVVGFCAPSTLIIFFYSRILYRLYTHNKSFKRKSQVNVRRVTCAIFMLIVFYFVCWTPYWGITLHSVFAPHEMIGIDEVQLMHILHSLVYVNSSFNWVLYAVLNKNLRECRHLALKRIRQNKTVQENSKLLDEASKKNNISASKVNLNPAFNH